MESRFGNLDHERGSLRLLLTLFQSDEALSREALMKQLHSKGVGKSAFYSSLGTCSELYLIEDIQEKVGNVTYTMAKLTSKGRLIAERLVDIWDILESEK